MKAELEYAFNVVVKYGFCRDCRWKFDSEQCHQYDCYENGVKRIREALEPAAADVAPVRHGRWIAVPSSDMVTGKAYTCSECEKMRFGSFKPNYCPNCGAKMDGGKDDG